MACGTPVVALDLGAVREVVDEGVTGMVFSDLGEMVENLPKAFSLDRRRIHPKQRGHNGQPIGMRMRIGIAGIRHLVVRRLRVSNERFRVLNFH